MAEGLFVVIVFLSILTSKVVNSNSIQYSSSLSSTLIPINSNKISATNYASNENINSNIHNFNTRKILQNTQEMCDGTSWMTCVHENCGTNIAEELYNKIKKQSCIYTGSINGRMWDCTIMTMDDPTYKAIFNGSCKRSCQPVEMQCQFTARFATPDRIYFDTEFCPDGSVVNEYKCGCEIMNYMQKAEYNQLMEKHGNKCTKICSEADKDLSNCQESQIKKNKIKEVEVEVELELESNCQQMLCIYKGCGVRVPKVAVDMIQSGDCYYNAINMWSCNNGNVQIDEPSYLAITSGNCIMGCDSEKIDLPCSFDIRYESMPEILEEKEEDKKIKKDDEIKKKKKEEKSKKEDKTKEKEDKTKEKEEKTKEKSKKDDEIKKKKKEEKSKKEDKTKEKSKKEDKTKEKSKKEDKTKEKSKKEDKIKEKSKKEDKIKEKSKKDDKNKEKSKKEDKIKEKNNVKDKKDDKTKKTQNKVKNKGDKIKKNQKKGKPKEKYFNEFEIKNTTIIDKDDKIDENLYVKKIKKDIPKEEDFDTNMVVVKYNMTLMNVTNLDDIEVDITKESTKDKNQNHEISLEYDYNYKPSNKTKKIVIKTKKEPKEEENKEIIIPRGYFEIYKSDWTACKQICNFNEGPRNIKERFLTCRHKDTGIPLLSKTCALDISTVSSEEPCHNIDTEICKNSFIPRFEKWSSCPIKCDNEAIATREFTCYSNKGSQLSVPKENCNTLNVTKYMTRTCTHQPCNIYKYVKEEWNECDCENSIKTRNVFCIDIRHLNTTISFPVSESYCEALELEKPVTEALCECTDDSNLNDTNSKRTRNLFQLNNNTLSCETGVFGINDECCDSGLFDNVSGECCVKGAILDRYGSCCYGEIDACGICEGKGKYIDAIGRCCEKALDANGLCCKSGLLDECGVCDGYGDSCDVIIEFLMDLNSFNELDSTMETCIIETTSKALLINKNEEFVHDIRYDQTSNIMTMKFSGSYLSYYTTSNLVKNELISAFQENTCNGFSDFLIQIDVFRSSVCGNGICELEEMENISILFSEFGLNSKNECPDDCLLTYESCPTSFMYSLDDNNKTNDLACSGRGICQFGLNGVCECFTGYEGNACEICSDGFYSIDGNCLISLNLSRIINDQISMVHKGNNTNDTSDDVQVMFVMFIAAFICLILISFMVATMAMKRKRSANAGFIFKNDSHKDLKSFAKTYSNIWETFQTALAKNSCEIESSSLTDIFTRHPYLLHTQNEHGVESEITPKKTPSPSMSCHANSSSQRSSVDLEKCHSYKKEKLRSTRSEDYTSHHPISPHVIEDVAINLSKTNSNVSSFELYKGHIDYNANQSHEEIDVESSACSTKTRELLSENSSTNEVPNVVNSKSQDQFYLQPIIEDEKSSDKSFTKSVKSDSEISYIVCPMPFSNINLEKSQERTNEDLSSKDKDKDKDKDQERVRVRVRTPSPSSTMIFCDPNENIEGAREHMNQYQNSSSNVRRNSVTSLFSSKSGKSRGDVSGNCGTEDKNIFIDTLGTAPNSLYGTLRIEEQYVEERDDNQTSSSSKRLSDFEFDRPSLESTLTKEAVYHRKGYCGNMKFRSVTEDDYMIDRSQLHSRSGMSERTRSRGTLNFCDHEEEIEINEKRRSKSRGFDYIMQDATFETDDYDFHPDLVERPSSAPLYKDKASMLAKFPSRDQLINAITLEDFPTNVIRKPVKLTSKRCNLSHHLLNDVNTNTYINMDIKDMDRKSSSSSLDIEDGDEMSKARCNMTSPMSDICVAVSKSSYSNDNHKDLRYPSEDAKMNSTTDDMRELKMRRPLKASQIRYGQMDNVNIEELTQMEDNLSS